MPTLILVIGRGYQLHRRHWVTYRGMRGPWYRFTGRDGGVWEFLLEDELRTAVTDTEWGRDLPPWYARDFPLWGWDSMTLPPPPWEEVDWDWDGGG